MHVFMYVSLYVRVWTFNYLPTRIRTAPGPRRDQRDVRWYSLTHHTRMLPDTWRRSQATWCCVSRQKSWAVSLDLHIKTPEYLQKLDPVATKNDCVCLIDAQIVSGTQSLDAAHGNKVVGYWDNRDAVPALKSWRGQSYESANFTSCTLLWR